MNVTIHNMKNGRKTEYTEADLKEEVRILRKQKGLKPRGTVTLHIFQGSTGSPVLEFTEFSTNTKGRTTI